MIPEETGARAYRPEVIVTMEQAVLIPILGQWQTKIEPCGHGSKITYRVRLASGIALKIHTMEGIDNWVIEFPWGCRTRVAKRRTPDRGLKEAKRYALTRAESNHAMALRTSKKLLKELEKWPS